VHIDKIKHKIVKEDGIDVYKCENIGVLKNNNHCQRFEAIEIADPFMDTAILNAIETEKSGMDTKVNFAKND